MGKLEKKDVKKAIKYHSKREKFYKKKLDEIEKEDKRIGFIKY